MAWRAGRQFGGGHPVALVGWQGEAGPHHGLAGRRQALGGTGEDAVDQGRALPAHHLADIDPVDGRLVGDGRVEVGDAALGPVEKQRPEGQFQSGYAHRQVFR